MRTEIKGKLTKTLLMSLFMISLLSGATAVFAGVKPAPDAAIVYYFHGQFRCYSCVTIENYTRKALEDGFQKELASGHLVWRPVNIEEPQNGRILEDYRPALKSVVIVKMRDGKRIALKNLPNVGLNG